MIVGDKLTKNQIKELKDGNFVLVKKQNKYFKSIVKIEKIGLIFLPLEEGQIIYNKKECEVYNILSLPKAVILKIEYRPYTYGELEDISLIDIFDNCFLAKKYMQENNLDMDDYLILEKELK